MGAGGRTPEQGPAPADGGAEAARRRREVAVAGHRRAAGDDVVIRAALDDADGDVRAAAVGAADRAGLLDDDRLLTALDDAHGAVRRRAVDLLARRALHPRADAALLALLDRCWTASPEEVEHVAWCLGERHQAADADEPADLAGPAGPTGPGEPGEPTGPTGPDAVVTTLVRVAVDHPEVLCREAAVAALGAIGDERGLPAILRATRDKATVRRRAIVALAAFEGPAVDEAIATATSDRDWQVRQIAEDLRPTP